MTDCERDAVRRAAFVIMPFDEPYNGYYAAIFKPALLEIGYTVSRADELRKPRPIILDIQEKILEADIILCELSNRNPNVFYELGLAHAVGKPVVLITHKPDDIPFDVSHIRVVAYDSVVAGWEARLRQDIQAAVQAAESADGEEWPPPLMGSPAPLWTLALANEIELNLGRIDRFTASAYRLADGKVRDATDTEVWMDHFYCTTVYYEEPEVQERIQAMTETTRSAIDATYEQFRAINVRAGDLRSAWRPWRAQNYLDAVEKFTTSGQTVAEALVSELRAM